MFIRTLGILGLASLLTMSSSAMAFTSSTTDVWNHHIQAWEARSVEGITSDYTDESVLVLNNQLFKGHEQIANVFTHLFKIFDAGVNRIDTPILFDRFVYIAWHFTPTGKQEYFGSDTFVVEGGKIVLQTIASPLYDVFPILPLNN